MKRTCSICKNETWSFHHDIFHVDYFVCDHCAFIFKDPEALLSEEDELKIYESHENSIEDPTYVAYFKRFLEEAVFPFSRSGKKGLDFGSGPSPVLSMILERDYGYDMDIYDLFYAPEKIYEGKSYDLITCTEVIEHLEDPLVQFQIMKEALNENGLLAIMTQFHQNDVKHFRSWHYMRDRSHIAFYRRKTLKKIAEIIGLEMIYCNDSNYATFRRK